MSTVPAWIEAVVAVLLVVSGILVLASAIGSLRLRDFFLRMHSSALAYTFGSWAACIAAALYFSALGGAPMLHPLLIPILLSVTVPITTVLLARVSLYRGRQAGQADIPLALGVQRKTPDSPAGDGDASPPGREAT